MNKISYVIIKHNDKTFGSLSALLENKYNPKAKYVLIEKITNKDSSESISRVLYSSNLEKLQELANKYVSWYNYPLNLYKEMQGNIYHLP